MRKKSQQKSQPKVAKSIKDKNTEIVNTNDPQQKINKTTFVRRINGYLHWVHQVKDSKGKIFDFIIRPLMVELHPRDIMQIIVGAALFAIPLSFSEEVWNLGEILPLINIIILALISFFFVAAFVYFNFYRFNDFKNHIFNYIKRVVATYGLSLLVVAGILTLIGKCPWGVDNLLAIKRIVIVAFPSTMAATLSDTLK